MSDVMTYSQEAVTMPRKRGDWEAMPIGERKTLTEAAQIIGISRETFRKSYAWEGSTKKLPEGFVFLREGKRAMFLLRTK